VTRQDAPGRLVELAGARHHVVVEGNGGPVVVLESGLGGGVLEWEGVAAALRGTATVVRRDRPGLGWSTTTPAYGGERTPTAAAHELKALLDHLGLAGPYVLVGHSLGGLHVRAFAGLYPADTAGVVLVDPSHELAGERIRGLERLTRLQVGLFRALMAAGPAGRRVLRKIYTASLASECAKPLAPATAEVLRQAAEHARNPEVLRAVGAEFAALDRSMAQMKGLRATAPLPPVPLRVISQGRPRSSRTMTRAMAQWQELHRELLGLSPDSAHLVADRSGHLVPLEQPEIVVAAVLEVLAR
jgi:pimeloyl-ACP methyl ester carboxylesterase